MTSPKDSGRRGGDRPTPKEDCTRDFRPLRRRLKALIVRAALWGVLPVRAAELAIRHGGLRHD
jgi:hypothetical protein